MRARLGALSLRTRLSAALVAVAVLTAALSAALTTWRLHSSFDQYLRERAVDSGRQALSITQTTYSRSGGRWTPTARDLLAHDLAASGYDYRLTDRAGRVVLDTTKTAPGRTSDLLFTGMVRDARGRAAGRLEAYALTGSARSVTDVRFAQALDRLHALAALVAGLVAIALGVFIAGRLSRPLRALAAAAPGLARGVGATPLPIGGPPEVQRLGRALASLAERLERQRSARLQLAQDLAHELRTPLMLMQSRLEAIEDGILPNDAEALAALHATTLRLGRLVGQIESLAEAEADPRRLERVPVRVDAVAGRAAGALERSFEERGVRVRLALVEAAAHADEDAVEQIATNLLANAAKYAPAGTEVTVRTEPGERWTELRVVDTGAVLAGPAGARVFERFYRGPGRRQAEDGFGLGLTIARALARDMGGDVLLETGEGLTAFVLRLPAALPPRARDRGSGPRPGRRAAVRAPGGDEGPGG